MGREFLVIALSIVMLFQGCSTPVARPAADGGAPPADPCATNNGGCPSLAQCHAKADGTAWCECPLGYRLQENGCREVVDPPSHSWAERCADSSARAQSTCRRGLLCYPLTDSNYCTKECAADADCGANGSFDNLCQPWEQGSKICLLGCDPNDRSTCARADLACYPLQDGSGQGMCLAACSTDADCSYGDRCEASSGVCRRLACDAGDVCADPDDVCYARDSDGQTVKSCVSKCSARGCPAGRQCNPATDACDPVIRATYERCGRGVGECAATDSCIGFGEPGSLCLTSCTADGDCVSGGTCSVALPDGQRLCAVLCGTAQEPDAAACSTGTACAWFTDDSRTTLFCGPKPE